MADIDYPHPIASTAFPWRLPEEIETSIPARFERVAASQPDAAAVIAGAASLTYAALNQAANRLAHALLMAHGPLFDQGVGFLFEHGAAQIVAMLGILKAGGYYVPVDLLLPEAMNREILADAQSHLLVTDAHHLEMAQPLAPASAAIINLSALAPDLPATNPDLSIDPDRLANLHYTSGSTGKPKGVMQNHRNMLHFMATIADAWPLRGDDRIAHLISCSFSAAMMPIWGALLNGAAVAPCNPRQVGVAGLVDWLDSERITIYFSVPALYRRLVERLAQAGADLPELRLPKLSLPELRLIILGGEPLLAADVESFRRIFTDGCRLLNIYAGAEMYYVCQYALDRDTPLTGPTAPIGFAVEGKEVLLLDEERRPVGPGEVGEIAVRSRYLATGYLNQPELTAAAFLPDPEGGERRIYLTGDLGRRNSDGSLVHMGRRNSMVKVRGQRVELGAVEHALRTCPGVIEAVVALREDARGEKVLVAYAVRQPTAKLTTATLRAALRERLPEVMVPQYVVFLDALPTTPGGKVDIQALPNPPRARGDLAQAYVAPRDELETRLAGLIEELIAVSPIGVMDHFGDLGMDSLNFMRLALQIESQLGQRIDLTLLAARPTLERLAELLRHPSAALTDVDQVTSAQKPTQRIDRRGRLAFAVPLPPLTPETSQELLLSRVDLPPTTELISFERNGQRRSLLAREMLYHHVAEGILAGEHYMIAFCGLCGSGVGFTPVIDGKRYHYVDAGIVNGTAILRDMESSSLWDSITGECYEGDLAGARLAFWPIEMTTVTAELTAWPAAILLRSGMGEEWLRDRAWMVDGWGLASQPEERPATFEHAFDPRLPPMTLGLGVMDAQHNARFYPLQSLPPKQALDDTWQGRPLQIQRHAVTGVPEARWRDDGTRPMQTLMRWYGFAFTYPGCEITPNASRESHDRTLSRWLRRLMRGWELAKSPQAMMRIGHWWHLLHFLSTRIGAGLAFYRTSVMVLNWLCGRRWFQAKLAQRTEMLQHFLAQSDVPVENPQRVLQQYLLLECLRMWKYEKALRRLTIGQLDQLIAVQGWQIFQEAISTGRGVILVSSHGGLPQTLSIYLAKQGYELALIGQINKPSSGARAQLSAETRTILFAQQLTDAFQTLTEGGLALILPDAKNGDAFVDLPFLERVRQFRTGFAELALMTGAVVLPAEATMTDSQKLRILFSEAFTCQAEPHQAQVVVLVEQYASYLRQIWRSNPANISYKHLKNYVDAKKTYATLISPGRGQ